jgi:hypothetical protein
MAITVEEFVAELDWQVNDEQLKGFGEMLKKLEDLLQGVNTAAKDAGDDGLSDVEKKAREAAKAARKAKRDLKKLKEGFASFGKGVAKAAVVVAGATTALAAWISLSTRATAVNARQAESVGLSIESYEALTGVVNQLGFEGEKAIDLIEEMNNKFGELKGLGELTSAEESLQLLNLSFKELKDLNPEEQFVKVMDAAKGLEDQQKAVSAVDMLMGGDANKFLGHLRNFDGTLEEILDKYKAMNFLTEEGAAGAKRFDDAQQQMLGSLNSMQKQLAALIGKQLAPLIEKFNEWIAANREVLAAKLEVWAERVSNFIQRLWTWILRITGAFNTFIDAVGGAENALNLLGIAVSMGLIAKLVLAMPKIIAFIGLMKSVGLQALLAQAKLLAIPLAIAAIIVLLALLAEDLYRFFTGGESFFGKLGEIIANFIWDTKESFKEWLSEIWEGVKTTFTRIAEWIREKIAGGIVGQALEFFGVDMSNNTAAATKSTTSPAGSPGATAAITNNRNRNQSTSIENKNTITINAAPGMNEKQIGSLVDKRLREKTAKAVRTNSTGLEY